MDELNDEGLKIYNDYKIHVIRWQNYIKSKCIVKLHTYLNTSGKVFDKNEYWLQKYMNTKEETNDIIQSQNMHSKYKKLCLLFHPDKFNNPRNTEFFQLINKLYSENNILLIDAINNASYIILELSDLKNIIENLSLPDIANKLSRISNPEDIINILNSKNITISTNINTNSDTNEAINVEETVCNNTNNFEECDFLSSTYYRFFINDKDTIDYINSTFVTENEIIKEISEKTIHDEPYVKFYLEKYFDNENIRKACKKWYEKINEHLSKENEHLSKENDILRKDISNLLNETKKIK
jgi:hypothetical protein